jgi:NHL repeat
MREKSEIRGRWVREGVRSLPNRATWIAVLLVTAWVFLAPSSALGAYVPQSPIGSPGPGDGEVELVASNLSSPPKTAGSGLAVNDTTHNFYVGDTDNHRVTVFAANGSFIGAFGSDVGGPGIDVCTIGCVAGTPGTSPGAFEDPTFVAVDNSASPSAGDVYVVDSATNVISKFEADGTLITTWGTGGQLNGSTATEGPFLQIGGIAVDPTGTLDVYRSQPLFRIFRFTEAGAFVETLPAAGAGSPGGLGVDSGGDFFKVEGTPRAQKLNPDGTEIGQVSLPENTAGLAIDSSNGDLFVVLTNGQINRYAFEPLGEVVGTGCTPAPEAGCTPTETLPIGSITEGGGLAVDATTHTLYAADPSSDEIFPFALVTTPDVITNPATGASAESATLNGEVNPNGAPLTECFFEWGLTTAYGQTAPCEDPDFEEVGEGTEFEEVHADISGLEPGTEYHFQLAAANANNAPEETIPGGDEDFQTVGPSIRNEAVSQVTASGAKVSGEVNPNGVATSFVVEYVTEAQFLLNGFTEAEQSPAQQIGSETTFKAVVQQLSGLDPQTAYRFRLVATNPDASVVGTGGKFTTFALPATDLPDNRKYEMVSPPLKTGEVIPPEPVGNLGSSCEECLPGINPPTMPMQAAPDGNSVLYEGQPFSGALASGPNEYVSERGEAEWLTQSLSSPITTGIYQAFSSDLSLGVLLQGNPALSPEAPTRDGVPFFNLYLRDQGGSFEPLITVEPPVRSLGGPGGFDISYSGANSGGALTPEFSHLLLEANDALTEEVEDIAPQAPEVAAGECTLSTSCNLYEWVEGELRLVNVLPGNASAADDAVLGSGRLLGPGALETANTDHAISNDGSRIFWSEEETGQVYVRVEGEETLEVPGPGSCKKSVALKDRACFLTASPDGTSVLLSDGQIYELSEVGPEAYEPTFDLTEGEGGFEGILGASEDLSRVYFIDTADLTGTEENANGEEAEAGELNLYAWGEGTASFIGVLLPSDNTLGTEDRYGPWKAPRPNRTAQASADGSYLAFMSQAALTGYDNRVSGGGQCRSSTGQACREVFLYAADSETLTCASCNPSGQRPLGPSNLTLLRPQLAGVPQPGNLSDEGEGRVFFESQDALVPQDTNGSIQDVYQWEPEGVGTCEQVGGCVALISSGHAANDSMFLDSSTSGDDAFFITRERLLTRDKDSQLDLYDARVDGGLTEPQPEICNGEGCAGPIPPAPVQRGALPPFVGPPNPSASKPGCKKGFVKKKGKCVKKQKKKKQAAKHKRGGSR